MKFKKFFMEVINEARTVSLIDCIAHLVNNVIDKNPNEEETYVGLFDYKGIDLNINDEGNQIKAIIEFGGKIVAVIFFKDNDLYSYDVDKSKIIDVVGLVDAYKASLR